MASQGKTQNGSATIIEIIVFFFIVIIILCCCCCCFFTFTFLRPGSDRIVVAAAAMRSDSPYIGIRKLMAINDNNHNAVGDSLISCYNTSNNNEKTHNKETEMEMEMELVLGSTPPRCVNSCRNCRPCNAVLVVPPNLKHKASSLIKRRRRGKRMTSAPSTSLPPPRIVVVGQPVSPQPQDEEESYYLLSWKCKCKNKLFQP